MSPVLSPSTDMESYENRHAALTMLVPVFTRCRRLMAREDFNTHGIGNDRLAAIHTHPGLPIRPHIPSLPREQPSIIPPSQSPPTPPIPSFPQILRNRNQPRPPATLILPTLRHAPEHPRVPLPQHPLLVPIQHQPHLALQHVKHLQRIQLAHRTRQPRRDLDDVDAAAVRRSPDTGRPG